MSECILSRRMCSDMTAQPRPQSLSRFTVEFLFLLPLFLTVIFLF